MFKRSNRLTVADLEQVKRLGRRVETETLSLKFTPPFSGQTETRAAVVATKRDFKKAVERNLVKRRARAVLARQLPRLPRPANLILWLKRPVARLSPLELETQIVFLLTQAKIL